MKYKKKPIVIEAIQWNGNNEREIKDFCGERAKFEGKQFKNLYIYTLEGTMFSNVGDYIIKGVRGEFYPCNEKVFLQTYRKVKED